MTTAIQSKTTVVENQDFKLPAKWNVIFYNDDTTSFDFVIQVLTVIFSYDEFSAEDKAREIHENGNSVVGTYFYEIAEQKSAETVYNARTAGFPLKVEIVPE